jgi:hypothetical protein
MGQKIILSEREKKRISDLHTSRVLLEQASEPATTIPPVTPVTPVTPVAPVVTEPRYKKAVCPAGNPKCDQTTLRIQIRMNDECKELTPKLVEDGRIGSKTTSAWTMCKSKLTPTKVVAGAGVPAAGVPAAGVSTTGTGTPTTDTKMTPADLATLGFK